MSYKDTQGATELGFVSEPAPVGGSEGISDLRLWAQSRIGFNTGHPFWFGGPSSAGQAPGTYPDGDYDDEYYPQTLDVDISDFNVSQQSFADRFHHWTNMTSYPTLSGTGHPLGPAYKVLQSEVTATGSQIQTFRADAAQFQWVWLFFVNDPDQGSLNFDIELSLAIRDSDGSLVASQSEVFTNAQFGRLAVRARQAVPRYSLEFAITRLDDDNVNADEVLPFRLAGRLGYRRELGFLTGR